MAKATANTVTKIEGVTLTLTEEEARILRRVLRKVGGPPAGPRGLIEGIEDELERIGVPINDNAFDNSVGDGYFIHGGIVINDRRSNN